MLELRTERCLLRPWRASDGAALAAINADPLVARHLPSTLTRAESDAMLGRIVGHFAAHGFGLWALEIVGSCPCAGFVGLSRVNFEAWFTPAVEIGWRLAPAMWGQGYATEAARAALEAAFLRLGLDAVCSFTVPANKPSWRVMERLGMHYEGEFDHPRLPLATLSNATSCTTSPARSSSAHARRPGRTDWW